jgi:hypothetical protein
MIIKSVLHGANDVIGEFGRVSVRVDRATVAATRAVQRKLVGAIRGELTGPPRWNHRGASRVYAKSVTLVGQPAHAPRGGPPGKFTGDLRRGVGGVKKLTAHAGRVTGGVGVGGGRIPQNNLKKGRLEAKYPFFAPAVRRVEPELVAIYEATWAKALARRGGL